MMWYVAEMIQKDGDSFDIVTTTDKEEAVKAVISDFGNYWYLTKEQIAQRGIDYVVHGYDVDCATEAEFEEWVGEQAWLEDDDQITFKFSDDYKTIEVDR